MEMDAERKLGEILLADPRYARSAYLFVFEALGYTVQRLGAQGHVNGRQLSEGIRDFALEQFGGLARLVLEEWGIRKTADFGEIVFNLVNHDLMKKTDQDSKEDFADVYRFEDVFRIDAGPPREPRTA